MVSIKWITVLSGLYSFTPYTDSELRQHKSKKEKKKTKNSLLSYNIVHTLNYERGRHVATTGMALQGEMKERRRQCHTAAVMGSRDCHHGSARHGQEGKASVDQRDVRIKGNVTTDAVPPWPMRTMLLMQGYPSQNNFSVERKPASFLSCSRSSLDREYNTALDCTAKGKLLWCFVIEFNHFQ